MRVIIAYAPEPQAPRTPRHAAIAHEAAVRKAQLHTISRRSAESRARTNDSGTQGLLAAEVLMWPLADLDESGTEFAEDSSLEGGGFELPVPPGDTLRFRLAQGYRYAGLAATPGYRDRVCVTRRWRALGRAMGATAGTAAARRLRKARPSDNVRRAPGRRPACISLRKSMTCPISGRRRSCITRTAGQTDCRSVRLPSPRLQRRRGFLVSTSLLGLHTERSLLPQAISTGHRRPPRFRSPVWD